MSPTPSELRFRRQTTVDDGVERAAFEALFRTYYGALCGFVTSYVREPAVAEELVQDLFLRLWEQRASHPITGASGDLRPYLFAAARNKAHKYLRHAAVERRTGPLVADAMTPEDERSDALHLGVGMPDPLDTAALTRDLRQAIHALPERRRAVAMLRWQQGMSHAEIARTLGVTVKAVEAQVRLGLATLRDTLNRYR